MANSILRFKFFRRPANERIVADSHRARHISMRKQSGFTLVELGISTAIVLVGLVFGGGALVQKINESAADATGTYMLSIRKAMNDGINKHNVDFANGDLAKIRMDFPSLSNPITRADGVKVYTIALSDFVTSGFLQSGFPTATPLKQAIQIQAFQLPGCTPAACTIESMANTTTPVRANIAGGNTDTALVGRVLTSLNGFGGASQSANPSVIKGSTFVQSNPIPTQDGIVAVYASSKTTNQGNVNVGTDPSGNPCVHIDTAGRIDVNCQGLINTKDIAATGNINASNLSASGKVTAGGVISAPAGNNIQVGSSILYGDSANTALRQGGGVYIQHYDGSSADIPQVGNISSTGSVNAAGNITSSGSIRASGTIGAVTNNWGLTLYDGNFAGNVAPQSSIGSAWVNDIYIRSIGKWASQINGSIKNYAEFDWYPGWGTFGTGLSYMQWYCAITDVEGKWAGGGENIMVYRDGGSGTWIVSGTSLSDSGGAHVHITCAQFS